MTFKDIGAFEKYLESTDEHDDEGSIIVREADIFTETDKKIFDGVKQSDFCKGSKNIDKKVV